MSNLLQEIAEHPFYAVQQELDNKLAQAEATLDNIAVEDGRFYIERLRSINGYVRHRLNSADPLFLPISQLDTFANFIRQQLEQINAYLSTKPVEYSRIITTGFTVETKKIQYLISANSSADQSLAQLGSIPYPVTSGDVEQMRENVIAFRRSVGQHIRNVQDEISLIRSGVDDATKQMQGITLSIDKQKQRIDKIVTDYQEQFSTGEQSRRESFTSAEENRGKHFFESEEKRQQQFEDGFVKRKTDMDEIVAAAVLDARTLTEMFERKGEEVIRRLNDYKDEAQNLVGVIGTTGIIHGYQAVANDQAKSARLWERLTVGCMGLLVSFGLYAFWLAHQENFNWHFLAARAMAVIPLGVFAAYVAHKAEQHRQIERESRKKELELAAINPYLATLPPDTQYEVKRILAERFFANDGKRIEAVKPTEQNGNPSELLKSTLENVKLVLETITKK